MSLRTHIWREHAERLADCRVEALRARDGRYLHAENAEAQAAAEDQIAREVWAELEREFVID